jgi:hypothetical protein
MKTKFLLSIVKALITWVVENYNPYANVTIVIIFFQLAIKDWGEFVKAGVDKTIHVIQHL